MTVKFELPDSLFLNGQALSAAKVEQLVAYAPLRIFATEDNQTEAIALVHADVLGQQVKGALICGPDYEEFLRELSVAKSEHS